MEQSEGISAEKAAAIREKANQDRQFEADMSKELFKSVIASGENALKAAMLINGGASVAFLAFLGNLMVKSQALKMGNFPKAMLCFVGGVLVAATATGLTYCAQHSYHQRRLKTGNVFNMFAIAFVVASYFLFAFGGWKAFREFQMMK